MLAHSATLNCTRGTQRARLEAAAKAQATMKDAWKRFYFAIMGGLAIVIPTIIIVVHKVPVKVLAVVSGSILVFSVSVAIFSRSHPESLLAVTAAYAAVLMVFMGNYRWN